MNQLRSKSVLQILKDFWQCSNFNDFADFQFACFFTFFREEIEEKLALHGCLTFSEYVRYAGKYIKTSAMLPDLVDQLMRPQYDALRKANIAHETYVTLQKLYAKLQTVPESLSRKIALADECVHAEHYTGKIFGFDIAQLRLEAEAAMA